MIRFVLSRASIALLLCATIGCGGDDGKDNSSGGASEDAGARAAGDAAPEEPGPVEYENNEAGLTKLFDDLLVALRSDTGEKTAARLVHSLILPDHEGWFSDNFSSKRRLRGLNEDYEQLKADIGHLALTLRGYVGKNQTKVRVAKFSQGKTDGAVGYQIKALAMTTNKQLELWSVRLSGEDSVYHVWSFVYVDGTFRYIGKLKSLVKKNDRKLVNNRDTLEFTEADRARILAADSPPDAGPR